MRLWLAWCVLHLIPPPYLHDTLVWLKAHRRLVVNPVTDTANVQVPRRFHPVLRDTDNG